MAVFQSTYSEVEKSTSIVNVTVNTDFNFLKRKPV